MVSFSFFIYKQDVGATSADLSKSKLLKVITRIRLTAYSKIDPLASFMVR